MRKLTINTFLTLDGVMQAPGGPEEDPSGGFQHGGWSVNYWDESMMKWMGAYMGKPFDLLLGRKTYEIFAAHWPFSDEPGSAELNNATKYVASRTLKRVDWKNSNLIKGDVAQEVAKLKRQDGPEIEVHGSSDLVQTLLKNDLIDEFSLVIFPLVLGSGKRLFGDGTIPEGFKLIESANSSTGVFMARFERLGPKAIKYGSFAKEQPTDEEVSRRDRLATESAGARR
jgi:dihydrofolate reductase